jgi:hypothetical protein
MLGSFSTRVITITALIIRTAMGSLAMIATSMLAAIMIERRGILLEDAPAVSIARFGTTGPESLFMLLLRRNTMEPTLRVLVVLLLLNTLAAQFVSTILLSDTSNGPIVTFPNTFSTGIGVKNGLGQITFVSQTTNSYNYLKTNPSTFESFAEYTEEGANEDGLDDTGLTLRAFLPVATQQDREAIQTYQGLARVFDASVSCARPEITDLR